MPRSLSVTNVIKPTDPRAASRQRKKDARKFNVHRRQIRAASKKEVRFNERIDNQAKVMNSLR